MEKGGEGGEVFGPVPRAPPCTVTLPGSGTLAPPSARLGVGMGVAP